jgi:outer membrane protein assembly factor BamA
MKTKSGWLLLFSLVCPLAGAEEPAASRTDQIAEEQLEKAKNLHPPEPDAVERKIDKLDQRIIKRLFADQSGWGVRIGGLVTGSGFALGPSYNRPDLLNENLQIKISAAGSLKEYYSIDAVASLPHLLNDHLVVDMYGRRSDSPQMPYYGPGPNSPQQPRTNYRREDNLFSGRIGARLQRHVLVGLTGGYDFINIGPGTSDDYGSTDQYFTQQQVPGLDQQSPFAYFGPFVQVDYRDYKNDPHRGTYIVAAYNGVRDQAGLYNFQVGQGLFEQYIPFFNEKRVIALRFRANLTWPDHGNQVPFYLQPTLGGSEDLRGYALYRFYDQNDFFMNAEYRWEVAPALDMAVFFDAGKVFPKPGDISFSGLRKDAGFGLRFKSRNAVAFRVDVGFSDEGFQVWFKFNPPFAGMFHSFF